MCYCTTGDQKKRSCWLLAVHLTGSAEQGCRPATGYQSWESRNLLRILISCPSSYSQSGDLQMYALKLKSLHIQRNKKKWNRYLSYHSSSEHTTVADGLDFSPALYLFTLSQDPDLLSLWLTLWLYSSRPLLETWRPSPLGRTISPGLIACLRPASLFCTAGKMDGKLNRTGSTTYLRIHTKS